MRTAAWRSGSVLRTKPMKLIRNGLWNVRQVCVVLLRLAPSARRTTGAPGSLGGSESGFLLSMNGGLSGGARFGQVRKTPLATRYDNSTAATGIRLCEWRWAFAFSGPGGAELCDRRFGRRTSLSERVLDDPVLIYLGPRLVVRLLIPRSGILASHKRRQGQPARAQQPIPEEPGHRPPEEDLQPGARNRDAPAGRHGPGHCEAAGRGSGDVTRTLSSATKRS